MKRMAKIVSVFMASILLVLAAGCTSEKEEQKDTPPSSSPAENIAQVADPYADPVHITIEMADGGLIKAELYPNLAPKTVANFTKLVKEKFYNGLIFHRVISGFMIQGGGYDENLKPKEADPIQGEFTNNGFENKLSHTRGVLSMARTNDPNSASSQFFIMHKDNSGLDNNYAAFGKVTEGLDVVDAIAATETETITPKVMEDVPVTPQIIKSISIDK